MSGNITEVLMVDVGLYHGTWASKEGRAHMFIRSGSKALTCKYEMSQWLTFQVRHIKKTDGGCPQKVLEFQDQALSQVS